LRPQHLSILLAAVYPSLDAANAPLIDALAWPHVSRAGNKFASGRRSSLANC
jgi:hypothetical protein